MLRWQKSSAWTCSVMLSAAKHPILAMLIAVGFFIRRLADSE
jgi:hypothetical protein